MTHPVGTSQPFLHGSEESKWTGESMGIRVRMLAAGADTAGAATIYEYTAPPRFPGPALHMHTDEDEAFFVLDGTLTVQIGDDRSDLQAGGFAWAPRDGAHGFCNATDRPVRFLGLVTPGRLEPMLRELVDYFDRVAPAINPSEVIAINRRHGVVVVGPPILDVPQD